MRLTNRGDDRGSLLISAQQFIAVKIACPLFTCRIVISLIDCVVMSIVSTSDFGRLIVKACSTVNATHAEGKLGLLGTEILRLLLRENLIVCA